MCPGPPRASLEACGVRRCWLCPCLRLAEGRHLGLSQGPQASPSLLWGLVSSPAQRAGPVLSGGHTGPPWGTESDLFLETEAQEDSLPLSSFPGVQLVHPQGFRFAQHVATTAWHSACLVPPGPEAFPRPHKGSTDGETLSAGASPPRDVSAPRHTPSTVTWVPGGHV